MQNASPPDPLDERKRFALVGRLIRIAAILLLVVVVLTSGNKLVALALAVVGYLMLMAVLNWLTRRKMRAIAANHPEFGGIMHAMLDAQLSEDEADEEDEFDDRLGTGDSRMDDWIAGLPADYPAFELGQADEDQPMADDGREGDTLSEDTTGHGADLEESIFEEGLMPCLHYVSSSPEEWVMTPWGLEVTLSIEVIAACAGAPSRDPGLARVRQWGRGIDYSPPEDLVKEMLGKIDLLLSSYQAHPAKYDLNPGAIDEVLACGQRMRDRVVTLLP